MNTCCCNKGKVCWCSKKPGASDIADDYYSVPSDLFCHWSKEINDEVSTIEKPSPQLIVALCSWKDKSHKKEQSVAKLDEQSTAATVTSTTAALLNTFLITQLN